MANKPPPRDLGSFSCQARIALINISPLAGGSLSRDAIRYQYMREGTLMEYFYILNFIRFFVMLVSEMEVEAFLQEFMNFASSQVLRFYTLRG